MDAITIRRLAAEDLALYRNLRLAALKSAPDAFGSVYAVEAARPDSAFAERLAGSLIFAAFRGEDAVGVAGLRQEDGEKRRHKAYLWGVHIAAEARGAGVGTAMIAAVLAAADALVEQVTLVVVSDNAPAIALYRKLGFDTYGVEPRALKSAGRYFDELLMVRFRPGK